MSQTRRKVRQQELSPFMADLRARGVKKIHRKPAGPDGMVEVTWEDREGFSKALQPWKPVFAMGLGVAVAVVVTVAVLLFL